MLSHLFKKEMGDKPYLQIEVDEHFSKVGVVTRIEAFLNSLSKREVKVLPADFNIEDVTIRTSNIQPKAQKSFLSIFQTLDCIQSLFDNIMRRPDTPCM